MEQQTDFFQYSMKFRKAGASIMIPSFSFVFQKVARTPQLGVKYF